MVDCVSRVYIYDIFLREKLKFFKILMSSGCLSTYNTPLKWQNELSMKVSILTGGKRYVTPLRFHFLLQTHTRTYASAQVLHPDDFDGHKYLKEALPHVKWTTGEHEYSRYGFRKLIEGRAIDILQPDVMWMGGLTEVCH